MKSAHGRADCSHYNDDEITDNDSSTKFVGFNVSVQHKLEEKYDSGETVNLMVAR